MRIITEKKKIKDKILEQKNRFDDFAKPKIRKVLEIGKAPYLQEHTEYPVKFTPLSLLLNTICLMLLNMTTFASSSGMEFFESGVDILQMIIIAIGAVILIMGIINYLESYANDNPGAGRKTSFAARPCNQVVNRKDKSNSWQELA